MKRNNIQIMTEYPFLSFFKFMRCSISTCNNYICICVPLSSYFVFESLIMIPCNLLTHASMIYLTFVNITIVCAHICTHFDIVILARFYVYDDDI